MKSFISWLFRFLVQSHFSHEIAKFSKSCKDSQHTNGTNLVLLSPFTIKYKNQEGDISSKNIFNVRPKNGEVQCVASSCGKTYVTKLQNTFIWFS